MNKNTVLLILLAAIVSLGLVLFQYFLKTKRRGKLTVLLSFLRFLGIFGVLLILINPKFIKETYDYENTNLVILADNSSSVLSYQGDILRLEESLNSNLALEKQFKIENYQLGASLHTNDSLGFSENQTNIAKGLKSLNEIYSKSNTAVILISDGNQTIGESYNYTANNLDYPVFPIVIGDTTRYEDVRVAELNTNKYAFLKNKFPIEAKIVYEGTRNVNATVNITVNGKNTFKKQVVLSSTNNINTINTTISADRVGVKTIAVSVTALDREKNTSNNRKTTAVEVIDEKTNIVIISDLQHPDIGALKKSIESNEQRAVAIQKPNVSLSTLKDVDLFILYQPTKKFKAVYDFMLQKKVNAFIVGGSSTDWDFINNIQKGYSRNSYNQQEDILPILNKGFNTFDISDFSIQDFPPLRSELGGIVINTPSEILLSQKIKGRVLVDPLLVLLKGDARKEAVLFGENIWKWRVQSFRNDRSFTNFDALIGKLMRYLADGSSKNRFTVDYQPIYQGSEGIRINATYFDEAFIFDADAKINLKIKGDSFSKEIPMLLKGNFFEADLRDLSEGDYTFTAKVERENYTKSGSFKIEAFNAESQFTSTNFRGLMQLGELTKGKHYFPNQMDSLITVLKTDFRFKPTQTSTKNSVSLIDFKLLLAIIILAFSAEWFIRKFNGLT